MRLVTGVTVFLTLGIVVDAKTTQLSSMDCAEGEDVKLPCNHSTVSGSDYILWYRQNPNQSPQYIIHGLQNTVTNSMGSLTIASDRKSSTLVLPKLTLRDTAVYYFGFANHCAMTGTPEMPLFKNNCSIYQK
uniref:Ig-like domain-containing protein n=1 Tax=Sus scrofa TaxID=9823 RepID=A0A8D1EJ55_PIG